MLCPSRYIKTNSSSLTNPVKKFLYLEIRMVGRTFHKARCDETRWKRNRRPAAVTVSEPRRQVALARCWTGALEMCGEPASRNADVDLYRKCSWHSRPPLRRRPVDQSGGTGPEPRIQRAQSCIRRREPTGPVVGVRDRRRQDKSQDHRMLPPTTRRKCPVPVHPRKGRRDHDAKIRLRCSAAKLCQPEWTS
jgi:hypothetical protein